MEANPKQQACYPRAQLQYTVPYSPAAAFDNSGEAVRDHSTPNGHDYYRKSELSTPVPPPRLTSHASTPARGATPRGQNSSGWESPSLWARQGVDESEMRIKELPHYSSTPVPVDETLSPALVALHEVPKSNFSQRLQRWKAMESPRGAKPNADPFHRQHAPPPQPSPRRESWTFSTRRSKRLEVKSSQNLWTDETAVGPVWTKDEDCNLPYHYDYATTTHEQRELKRVHTTSAFNANGNQQDAPTVLKNIWSGSSRALDADVNAGRTLVAMNMVSTQRSSSRTEADFFTPNPANKAASAGNRLRATWSEGANTRSVRASNWPKERCFDQEGSDSAAWLTRIGTESETVSPGSISMLRASFQGP